MPDTRLAAILDQFHEQYPSTPNPRICRAPGRVNLIGEHTDYNLGLVLPMAIDLACYAAAAPSGDEWTRVLSTGFAESVAWREIPAARGHWSDRVAGIAWALARRGAPPVPLNILISSSIPIGAGLSSSAALGLALALALGGPRDLLDLARIAHSAESEFVGVPCGMMDQYISAHGQAGAALLLDCRSLASRPIRIPEGVAIVIANSMVKHELGASAYRTRVEECAAAARAMGVATLRDATLAKLHLLAPVGLKRARHAITENARVERFAQAAERGDVETMGRLATESHASLRDDYEVSCPELDFLVETALQVPGVMGARMTGGGFGGCTVNFVRTEAVLTLKSTLERRYEGRWGHPPEVRICEPSGGASQLL